MKVKVCKGIIISFLKSMFCVSLLMMQSSCRKTIKNDNDDLSLVVSEIEHALRIEKTDDEIKVRLENVMGRMDSLLSFKSQIRIYKRDYVIKHGETFEADIIPIRLYEGRQYEKAVVGIGDSIWVLGNSDGVYSFKTNCYENGKNIVEGLVQIGRDTVPVSFDFYVE